MKEPHVLPLDRRNRCSLQKFLFPLLLLSSCEWPVTATYSHARSRTPWDVSSEEREANDSSEESFLGRGLPSVSSGSSSASSWTGWEDEEERILSALARAEEGSSKHKRRSAGKTTNSGSSSSKSQRPKKAQTNTSTKAPSVAKGNTASIPELPSSYVLKSSSKLNSSAEHDRSDPSPGKSKLSLSNSKNSQTHGVDAPPSHRVPYKQGTTLGTSTMNSRLRQESTPTTSVRGEPTWTYRNTVPPLRNNMATRSTGVAPAREKKKPVSPSSSTSATTPWVRKYLAARPKDVLLPVPKEYLGDGFNLAQLAAVVERIGFQALDTDSEAMDLAQRLVEMGGKSYPIYRQALLLLLIDGACSFCREPTWFGCLASHREVQTKALWKMPSSGMQRISFATAWE